MMRITFRMVSKSLFGTNLKDKDVELISRTISTVQEFMVRQIVQPYLDPWFLLSGELRKHEKLRERADSVVLDYIGKRRRQPGSYDDMLQILMYADSADTGKGMSDQTILHEIMQ